MRQFATRLNSCLKPPFQIELRFNLVITKIVSEKNSENKKEIVEEVNENLSQELTESIPVQVKTEFENKIDSKTKEFESHTNDIADGVNIKSLREKFHDQLHKF